MQQSVINLLDLTDPQWLATTGLMCKSSYYYSLFFKKKKKKVDFQAYTKYLPTKCSMLL